MRNPGVFFIFFKFLFSGVVTEGVGGKVKDGPKWEKFLSVAFHISGIMHHMIFIYGTHAGSEISYFVDSNLSLLQFRPGSNDSKNCSEWFKDNKKAKK